jgi:hypothetical protein
VEGGEKVLSVYKIMQARVDGLKKFPRPEESQKTFSFIKPVGP